MRWLLLVVLSLAGCGNLSEELREVRVVPLTTQVSKAQEFELPKRGVIYYEIVDPNMLKQLGCSYEALGCALGVGTDKVTVFVGDWHFKYVLEHELMHVVYGPKHVRERR